ncbi:hypothetical protein GRF29_8g253391 [Pseudopithomyces chartarum]|uniref:Malic enzyme n=1 Tax=Pseudopithomyces chartarum TaxID=1892770 RepID=A0AAN6M480_9PLEO|nr:hypothetical protein GRF29_8g253391 [Pseudopithomyces chartarum]
MSSTKKEQKNFKFGHLPLSTSGPQETTLTGNALLRTSYFNKGSAFTHEERDTFKLHGLLPSNVQTLDEQVRRAYAQYQSRPDDLAKNTFMTSIKQQNEVLYYRLILEHLQEMFSIIYTPTEGDAIADYSRLFRKPEGCYLDIEHMDRIEDDIDQFGGTEDVDIIVVSDGEQILGIGDQGVGAILISVAKLVIYTLCAGIHPARTLPVVLDCGTNNEDLLKDDLYLGLRQKRARGEKYDEFVDRFITACRKRYPKAYIHFEDFGLNNARRILDKYTPKIACFNDDVQGTGAVTLAAIMAAFQEAKVEWVDARFVMFGSVAQQIPGTAGTGIADQITDAIAQETGKSKEEAGQQIWCVDKPGLLLKSKKDQLTAAQFPYAREDGEWENKNHNDLYSVVKEVKPHVLIGTSTVPGSFTKDVVQEMAKHVERPIIFPLSNPTRLHEAKPQDLYDWTNGKVLVATGSPFSPVKHDGKEYDIAECNNSTTFPGIGLGAVLSRTKLLTPSLIVAAVRALAAKSPISNGTGSGLLPDVTDVREISVQIAKNVIQQAVKEDLAQEKDIPTEDADLEEWIREQMWDAEYRPLKLVKDHEGDTFARGEADAPLATIFNYSTSTRYNLARRTHIATMRFTQVLPILTPVAIAAPMFDTGAATAARLTSVAITATLAVRGESPSVASGYDSLEAKHNGIPYAPPVTTTVTETVFSTTTAYDTATTEYITEFEVLPPVTTTVTDLEVIPAITVTVTDFHILPPVTVTMTDYISSTPEPNPNNSVAEMTNPLNRRFELPDVWSNTQEESYLKTLDGILANLLDDEQFAIYQSATKSKVAPFPQEKATRRRMFPYQFGLVTQRFFTHRDKTDPEQIWDEPRQRAYLYSSAMVLKPYLTSKQWRTLRSFQAMASGFNDTESFSPRLKAAWDLGHLIYDSFPDDLLDVSPYKSLPKSEVILHGYQDDEIDALDTKPKGEDEGEPKDQDESKDKSKDDSKDTSKDESKDQDKSKDDSKDEPKEESKDKPKEESKDQDKSDQDSKDQDKSKDDPKSQDDSKDQEKPKDDPKSQDTPKDPNDKSPDNTPQNPPPPPLPPTTRYPHEALP